MNATSPFELLAQELGAVAGRVEREAAYRIAALIADVERRFAERELQIERLQKSLEAAISGRIVQWDQMITDKLITLQDGKDGRDGIDGKDGIDGAQGLEGAAGPQGLRGLQGEKGEAGPVGPAGKDGVGGAAGSPGERGERGADGANGAPGKLPKVKQWLEGSVQYEGDVVTHAGGLYQALKDTGKTPGTNDWICLAAPGVNGVDGRHGEDGISMNIRETFDPNEKYCELDVVTLDQRWFVAKYDNPGMCPGPGWKSGPGIGKTGKPGPRGERGLKGEPGTPMEIITWELNRDTYEVTPIMINGERGAVIPLRELFEQFQEETA
jgi:Collagen triple helix repeat (20 copies)